MNALRTAVRGFGDLCITLGILLLLFLVWQLWWTDLSAGRVQDQLTQQVQRSWDQGPATAPTGNTGPKPVGTKLDLREGRVFALLRVPRFGANYVRPVLQGIKLEVLDDGIGHYPTSANPGEVGNFAVAGHRVTYAKPFGQIAELRKGDPIVVETATAWYVYRVTGHTIVTPDRVDVVDPVPEQPGRPPTRRLMTMTACHPQFSARQRYVVYSQLSERLRKQPGVYPDVLGGPPA